jgi:FAD/FMN-containing dehydrogenases
MFHLKSGLRSHRLQYTTTSNKFGTNTSCSDLVWKCIRTTNITRAQSTAAVATSTTKGGSTVTPTNHNNANTITKGRSESPSIKRSTALTLVGLSLGLGYAAGSLQSSSSTTNDNKNNNNQQRPVLPSGLPRNCCSCDAPSPPPLITLTPEQQELPNLLSKLVGKENVISGLIEDSSNSKFLKGARLGRGKALAIVQPESLVDAVKALELIVNADCVVIPQGQNTGLTGGSVPREEKENGSPRPTIILNMKKLDTMFPIDDGEKPIPCVPCRVGNCNPGDEFAGVGL